MIEKENNKEINEIEYTFKVNEEEFIIENEDTVEYKA